MCRCPSDYSIACAQQPSRFHVDHSSSVSELLCTRGKEGQAGAMHLADAHSCLKGCFSQPNSGQQQPWEAFYHATCMRAPVLSTDQAAGSMQQDRQPTAASCRLTE